MEFKKYLHGVSDAGSRLLFKFRSGTHGLNEELGRHRDRVGKCECSLCGAECESVVHVLWECSAYCDVRISFKEKLQELLGDKYLDFDILNSVEKTSYVLGSELWEDNFDPLISLVKEFILELWEVRKVRLYGNDSFSQSQSSAEGLGSYRIVGRRGDGNLIQKDIGKFCQLSGKVTEGKLGKFHNVVNADIINADGVCADRELTGSTHGCRCVVDGSVAMAAY